MYMKEDLKLKDLMVISEQMGLAAI
jgi:hypothetical protein